MPSKGRDVPLLTDWADNVTFTPLYSLKTHSKSGMCSSSQSFPYPGRFPIFLMNFQISSIWPHPSHCCPIFLAWFEHGAHLFFYFRAQGMTPPCLSLAIHFTQSHTSEFCDSNFHGSPIPWDRVRASSLCPPLRPRERGDHSAMVSQARLRWKRGSLAFVLHYIVQGQQSHCF